MIPILLTLFKFFTGNWKFIIPIMAMAFIFVFGSIKCQSILHNIKVYFKSNKIERTYKKKASKIKNVVKDSTQLKLKNKKLKQEAKQAPPKKKLKIQAEIKQNDETLKENTKEFKARTRGLFNRNPCVGDCS